jgi:hypothetical protein
LSCEVRRSRRRTGPSTLSCGGHGERPGRRLGRRSGCSRGGASAPPTLARCGRVPAVGDDQRQRVPHRVDHPGRDGQGVTGTPRPRRLALNLILQRPVEDVGDLFARMDVLDRCCFGADTDALLDDRAPGTLRSCCCRSVRHSPGACGNLLPRAPPRSSVALITPPGCGRDDAKTLTAACHHPVVWFPGPVPYAHLAWPVHAADAATCQDTSSAANPSPLPGLGRGAG